MIDIPQQLSPKDRQAADKFGGTENDYSDYKNQPQSGYADKGGHRERSSANSEQHQGHWEKNAKKS